MYKLKKDIVIKAGTKFKDVPIGTTTTWGSNCASTVIGLTDDSFGFFTYSLGSADLELEEWFEYYENSKKLKPSAPLR